MLDPSPGGFPWYARRGWALVKAGSPTAVPEKREAEALSGSPLLPGGYDGATSWAHTVVQYQDENKSVPAAGARVR